MRSEVWLCHAFLLLSFAGPLPAVTLTAQMVTRAVDGCTQPTAVTNFLTTDPKVFLWFSVRDAKAGDVASAEWLYPDGKRYKSGSWNPVSSSGSWCYWWEIPVAGNPPASNPGRWAVRILWNNTVLATLSFSISEPAPPVTATKRVVIIDIDGLRPDVFDKLYRDGKLPAFARLLGDPANGEAYKKAVRYANATTVFPSITFAAQASLFTGVYPGKHGIVGNSWFNRNADDGVNYTGGVLDSPCVYEHGLNCEDGLANRHLRSQTLYEAAQPAIQAVVVFNPFWKGAQRHFVPSVTDCWRFVEGESDSDVADMESSQEDFAKYDQAMVDKALSTLGDGPPDLLTVYFAGLDAIGHRYGFEAGSAYVNYLTDEIDRQVDRLLTKCSESTRDPDWRNTLFIITSDHGRSQALQPGEANEYAGRIKRAIPGLDSAVVRTNGGMAHIYIRDGSEWLAPWNKPPRFYEDILPAAAALVAADDLKEIVWKVLVRTPEQGYFPVDSSGNIMAPSRDSDLVGKRELIEALNHERSGDILVLLKPGHYFLSWHDAEHRWGIGASHGSIHEDDLAVPMIFAGGGVRPGESSEPVSTVNIARTVARYLGFENRLDAAEPALPVSFGEQPAPPEPVRLLALEISPNSLVGGESATGTVTLNRQATAAVAVSLSSDSAVAEVPATVVVPAGGDSARFTIKTRSVQAAQTVRITAKSGDVSRTATLTVNAPSIPALSKYLQILVAGTFTAGGQRYVLKIQMVGGPDDGHMAGVTCIAENLMTAGLFGTFGLAFRAEKFNNNAITFTRLDPWVSALYGMEMVNSATMKLSFGGTTVESPVTGSLKLSTASRTVEGTIEGRIADIMNPFY
ncbi:MAG: alkaline phosphatase family protein [Bryobacteraceae bacterium]